MTNPVPGEQRCVVCRMRVPVWPSGWLRTDDGRDYCPDHKGDQRFRMPVWRLIRHRRGAGRSPGEESQ